MHILISTVFLKQITIQKKEGFFFNILWNESLETLLKDIYMINQCI